MGEDSQGLAAIGPECCNMGADSQGLAAIGPDCCKMGADSQGLEASQLETRLLQHGSRPLKTTAAALKGS